MRGYDVRSLADAAIVDCRILDVLHRLVIGVLARPVHRERSLGTH